MNRLDDSRKKKMASLGEVLDKYKIEEADQKYVSREFQQYGLELAEELNDLKHKSLYIKMAKETDRNILESARRFIKDASNAKSPARLFMWKVKQIKQNVKEKNKK